MPEYGQVWQYGNHLGVVVMLIREVSPRHWLGITLTDKGYVQILPWAGLPGEGRPALPTWTLLEG